MSNLTQLKALEDWAHKNSILCSDDVTFAQGAFGSALVATRPIHGNPEKPTLLISCPEKYLIGPRLAHETFKEIWEENPHIRQPLIKLAFLAEVCKGSDSIWKLYFDILPNSDEINLPTCWTEDELAWLQGTNIYGNVESRKIQWDLELDDLKAYVDTFDWDTVSAEKYYWASSIFLSRAFPARVIYNGNEYDCEELNLSMLIPVLDSLNHKPETPVFWKASSDSFTFSAGYEVKAGQEIFNNYGPKGNEELLMAYGFCLDTQDYDLMTLKLLLPPVEGISEVVTQYDLETIEGYIVSHLTLNTPLNLPLLNFFTYMSHKSEEMNGAYFPTSNFSTVDKMRGCQSLMAALGQKYAKVEEGKVELNKDEKKSLSLMSKKRYECAKTYKDGQEAILQKSMSKCQELFADLVQEAIVKISFEELFQEKTYNTILREMLELSEEESLFEDGNGDMAVIVISALEKVKGKESKIYAELEKVWVNIDEMTFEGLPNKQEYEELLEWCDFKGLKSKSGLEKYLGSKDINAKLLAETKSSIACHGFWKNETEFMYIK